MACDHTFRAIGLTETIRSARAARAGAVSSPQADSLPRISASWIEKLSSSQAAAKSSHSSRNTRLSSAPR